MRAPSLPSLLVALALLVGSVLIPGNRARPPVSPREREARIRIAPRTGLLPRLSTAFAAAEPADPALADAAALIEQVLRADLEFEEAFELMPAIDPGGAPPPDGELTATLRHGTDTLHLEVRLRDVRSGEIAFGREYVGPAHKPRLIAHVAANDLLFDQAGVQGLAHSRLAFVSDRLGSFREPTGSVRRVKEIFAADYDGANEQRVTADGDLDMTPAWSPDGRAIAYTSFRRGFQDIFITRLRRRPAERAARREGPEPPARLVARRHAHRLLVQPRRQRGDLRDEPGRLGRCGA